MTKQQEYEAAKQAIKDTLADCQRQNEKLIRLAKFYADRANWRNRMAQMDQGDKARDILDEIEGRKTA